MIHVHSFDGKNKVHVYEFRKTGENKFYVRGVFPGFEIGDQLNYQGRNYQFEKVLKQSDSAGKYNDPKNGINSLIEAELSQI